MAGKNIAHFILFILGDYFVSTNYEYQDFNNEFATWFCLIQGIYKNFDADHSGVIGSDELPGAFKAAGE